jgi:carbamoyl-phosphate synthase small subunit
MSEADAVALADRSPGLVGRDLVAAVTCEEPYVYNMEGTYHVVAVDCGIKTNILRLLANRACRVTVVPASATAADILALGPDGLFLSNGPGDPDGPVYLVDMVRQLIGSLPIFGICLGQQITALAAGSECYKLKFGHHGSNHPVKDLASGAVAITSQNHGFAVRSDSLPADYKMTQVNLNDDTVEGIEHRELPVYAIQYHPEAAPGPHDARPLFDRFIADMAKAY